MTRILITLCLLAVSVSGQDAEVAITAGAKYAYPSKMRVVKAAPDTLNDPAENLDTLYWPWGVVGADSVPRVRALWNSDSAGVYIITDSVHDPSANFDTLYWRWVDPEVQVWVDTDPPILKNPPHWERIPGRWDTTTVRVCDTVWTTTDKWWQIANVISVAGDTTIYRFRHDGPCAGCQLLRTQVGEVRCRERIIVTPKAIRFESGRR